MRGIYDLAFAFEDGDVTRPRLAAGVALRGAMRMFFTYRGSLFWRMSAGMGDIVFAPLYQVLKHRGVRFEFFHRLRNVGLRATRRRASLLQCGRWSSTCKRGSKAAANTSRWWRSTTCRAGRPAPAIGNWCAAVRWSARAGTSKPPGSNATAGTKTLHVTRDFDFVVLGVSVGALPEVARELLEREPAWRDMVRHVKTVPTQAFQIWMRKDARELGWLHPPINLSGFVEPFDTWADMSHLIAEESWKDPVKSIAYFCSVLPDAAADGTEVNDALQREQLDVVRANAIRFLDHDVKALWPEATKAEGGFRWEMLAADGDTSSKRAGHRASKSRFDTQFWRANINPTDRYVQSLPGSIAYRVSPLDMTFDNLTIAGDWTATGLDTGCIEVSAVISGLLASHAISGRPRLQDIVGYDHP